MVNMEDLWYRWKQAEADGERDLADKYRKEFQDEMTKLRFGGMTDDSIDWALMGVREIPFETVRATKVYLAGPMRGYPDFNFPAFHYATKKLRDHGYDVFSPAERDINNGFDPTGMKGDNAELTPAGFNLREALATDIEYVCREADMVVVLPGWEKSSGANAEVAAARALNLPVMTLAEALGEPDPQSPREKSLLRALKYVTGDRNNAYGPPTQDFERTADLWTAFGFRFVPHKHACTCGGAQPIVPHHIANAQILLKQSRLAWQPEKPDSWDDTSGYSSCGHECVVAEQSA